MNIWIKLIFYIILIAGLVFVAIYISENQMKFKNLDVLAQKYYHQVKDSKMTKDPKCIVFYEPEEIFNLGSYLHTRQELCERDIFIVDPAIIIQEGNNIGRMKFFLSKVEDDVIQINNIENEIMTNNFRSGNFVQVSGERLYLEVNKERCVVANRYVPQDNVKYCFTYDGEDNVILNVQSK